MYYGGLFVGDHRVSRLRDGVPNELLAAFRREMYQSYEVLTSEYWQGDVDVDDTNEFTTVKELVCPGSAMVDRLNAIGCTLVEAKRYLQESIEHSRERARHLDDFSGNSEMEDYYVAEMARYEDLDADKWIQELGRSGFPDETSSRESGESLRSSAWLLDQIAYWDERFALRLLLEIFPHDEVRLDMTEMIEDGEVRADLAAECADAVLVLRTVGSLYSPAVVLTEGRSDAEILLRALKILYTHLDDLIRFLDYSRKPEGGAGPLVATVRTFASAGIANRLIAVFDNDSAAAEALTSLDLRSLPQNIRVLQYPKYDLATRYPTLGPPSIGEEREAIRLADVNGLAGSVELYLGRDVLMQEDGVLMPVQWRSFLPKVKRYHGSLLDKGLLQAKFARKAAAVESGAIEVVEEHWEGVRLILDNIKDVLQEL